jgi:hypothetical protein
MGSSESRRAGPNSGAWGGILRYPNEIVQTIRSSLQLSIAFWGAVIVLLAYVLQYGVWAAVLAIWGTFLVVFGLAWYLAVRVMVGN